MILLKQILYMRLNVTGIREPLWILRDDVFDKKIWHLDMGTRVGEIRAGTYPG